MTAHDPPPPQMQTFEFCPTQGRIKISAVRVWGSNKTFCFPTSQSLAQRTLLSAYNQSVFRDPCRVL